MAIRAATPLNRQQVLGFWAAWFGWMLDGMDSVIYALVLAPAMKELAAAIRPGQQRPPTSPLPARSCSRCSWWAGGFPLSGARIADRFGRARCLAATILIFSVFTGAAALRAECVGAGPVPLPGRHRHRRRMGDGRHLCRGSLAGRPPQDRARAICRPAITPASSWRRRSTTPSARAFGWRAMFLCGAAPVLVALFTLSRVKEPPRWQAHACRRRAAIRWR